ncbi:hypothetical protein [Pedobacter aquatilis]|uniref:hypothetical protein n=1 Tax=Pedobacter aquatilis TaxID=351343 RepID=UPI00292EA80A|nr:hypothetical protein [Pedobacter aquatilis]
MKIKLAGALIIAVFAYGSVSFAQTPAATTTAITPKEVHKWDRKRVKAGVKSGELTKAEAKALRAENKKLKTDVKAAKADGSITIGEKKNIAKEEARLSKNIYAKKHNARKRV